LQIGEKIIFSKNLFCQKKCLAEKIMSNNIFFLEKINEKWPTAASSFPSHQFLI
jgi:hypothetical protein